MQKTYWLKTDAGAARQVTPAGLLLGRAPSCDLVLPGPTASRRQALIYLAEDGPEVIVMGRGEVTVDGEPVAERAALPPGATLVVGDLSFSLDEDELDTSMLEPPLWVLQGPSGGMFSVGDGAFSIGGDPRDDLRVEDCAERAVVLSPGRHGLDVTAGVDVRLDGRTVEAGDHGRARAGSVIEVGELAFQVVAGGALGEDSTIGAADTTMTMIRLEFLPRGGRLHIVSPHDTVSLYLSERPCDFVAVLLAPPPPLSAGDAIPDDHMWSRVWGAQPSGRKTVNVLLHRLRRDLDRAGLDGGALIERVAGGGATRFVLPPGVHIQVE